MLAFDPGEVGLGLRHSSPGGIADRLQRRLALLLRGQRGLRGCQFGVRSRCGGLRGGQRHRRIALSRQAIRQLGLAPDFAAKPIEPLLGGTQFGFGDTPFGLDPGLVRGGLRQGQLGSAQDAVGIAERGSHQRSARFVCAQRGLSGGQIAFEFSEGLGSIAG